MATTCLGPRSGERFVEFGRYGRWENAALEAAIKDAIGITWQEVAAAPSRTQSLEIPVRASGFTCTLERVARYTQAAGRQSCR